MYSPDMHLAPGAKSKPPDDAARLALFGPPVFGFVPQPRLQERGWSWYGNHGRTLEAQAHYWLADPSGKFWFEDSPVGPIGIAELRGFVFTDVPGSTNRGGDPIRDALNQHLQYIVMNYAKNPYEFGSELWAERHTQQQAEIELALAHRSNLIVDDTALPAIVVTASDFTGTAMVLAGRVVTVVIHSADVGKIDVRLIRRV
ncbi:hypothetical protein [Cryobacterium sp. Y50]|uniref:hypothetical protein n=2 Tax=unclassified Cryobacterium TaxID=2649013 RepID=UPI0013047CA4|nr:hypothetical protein [Cryobacterium sp. Y50]